ncbi:dTDP-4-dehydrorhamnose 3,5-epimerase [Methylophilaceae bacterium]|nr:dTDP-4-dehydrorhamnose 3,5-epimerase [Methylophilaceae bacterium]
MKITATTILGPLLIQPDVFEDARGFFFESFNQRKFEQLAGISDTFVQDNHSGSARNILRGLHYQIRQPQGKLIRVVAGEIFDVALDLRKNSPTLGQWVGNHLSAENRLMFWIPHGFAHGFLSLTEYSEVIYKTTDYWAPEFERCIVWDDPGLAIDWPLQGEKPVLSKKDQEGLPFSKAELFP